MGQNPADAVRVSSFVGGGPNRAMLVRWEEFGSARLRGEMRLAGVAQCSGTSPERTEIDTHRSRFKGTRDRGAVVLDLPARAPGGLGGTWAGELLYGAAGEGSPPGRPVLRLEDPDGNRVLLHEGAARDYADAVARLAETCGRTSTGPP